MRGYIRSMESMGWCMNQKQDLLSTLEVIFSNLRHEGFSAAEIKSLVDQYLLDHSRLLMMPAGEIVGLSAPIYQVGEGVIFDPSRQCIYSNGSVISLSPIEARLFHVLLSNRERVLGYEELVKLISDEKPPANPRQACRLWVYRLRKKLNTLPGDRQLVWNVRSVGYYFSFRGE